MHHFDYLKEHIHEIINESQNLKTRGELRIWSSAASTGAEPYSLAMLMDDILPSGMKAKILGTDVSAQSLQTAINGTYKVGGEDFLPPTYLQRYFVKQGDLYAISDKIKESVTFRLFNLMSPFPFKSPFDIIFCRNVMIYFNQDVQTDLINKFYNSIVSGGLLLIGHSESLSQIQHKFRYTAPTIYKKP
jgi:chemotaxis protein methyltransferase CheR